MESLENIDDDINNEELMNTIKMDPIVTKTQISEEEIVVKKKRVMKITDYILLTLIFMIIIVFIIVVIKLR